MKRLTIGIFILFSFHLMGYGQDTILRQSYEPTLGLDEDKRQIWDYIGYWVSVQNPNFPQTVRIWGYYGVGYENLPKYGDTIFYSSKKNEKFTFTAKYPKITAINSKELHLTGMSKSDIELELQNSYHIYVDSLFANFLRITDHNQNNSKLVFNLTKGQIDTVYSYAHFKTLKINDATIHRLILNGVVITDTLVLKNDKIDTISLIQSVLPNEIRLSGVDLSDMTSIIDFTRAKSFRKNINIFLNNVDFKKLKIPLDRFTIYISDDQSYEQKKILYQQVLTALKENGLTEKYEVLDKRYQEIQYLHGGDWFRNFISKHWWNYGYNKGLIFRNSCILFIFFFVVNLFCFDRLVKVYIPNNIEVYYYNLNRTSHYRNYFKKTFFKSPIILLYTAFIFWGLKLDLKELKIKNWFFLSLIILEYTVGIICLAYLANYIITK